MKMNIISIPTQKELLDNFLIKNNKKWQLKDEGKIFIAIIKLF